MLYIFYLIGLLFVTTTIETSVPIDQLSSNKNNSGQCTGGLLGIETLKSGEFVTMSRYCIKIMCDEFSVLHYNGCATYLIKLPPNCKYLHLKADSLNQYPDCCPYVDCYGNSP